MTAVLTHTLFRLGIFLIATGHDLVEPQSILKRPSDLFPAPLNGSTVMIAAAELLAYN